VTGGLGFIGSRLCEALLARGRAVRCVDDLSGRHAPSAGPAAALRLTARGAEVLRADVAAAPEKLLLDGVAAVVHLAGLPGVRTGRPPAELWRRNALASEHLARAAARRGARFLLASTSAVYGNARLRPTPEDAPPDPLGPYARSKFGAERACLRLASEEGADALAVRLFTVYGPGQRPDMAFAGWIGAMIERRPLRWHVAPAGARDFTYVDDAVAGLLSALDRGRAGQVYNVSGGRSVALDEALALIERGLGRRAKRHRIPAARGEAVVTSGCGRKAAAELGYAPHTDLSSGLERQLAAALAVSRPRPRAARARARASRRRAGSGSAASARGRELPRPPGRLAAAIGPG
jgi:UDP-glucuronate 4-epimerase